MMGLTAGLTQGGTRRYGDEEAVDTPVFIVVSMMIRVVNRGEGCEGDQMQR